MYVLIFFDGIELKVFGDFDDVVEPEGLLTQRGFQKVAEKFEWVRGNLKATLVELGVRPDLHEYLESLK